MANGRIETVLNVADEPTTSLPVLARLSDKMVASSLGNIVTIKKKSREEF